MNFEYPDLASPQPVSKTKPEQKEDRYFEIEVDNESHIDFLDVSQSLLHTPRQDYSRIEASDASHMKKSMIQDYEFFSTFNYDSQNDAWRQNHKLKESFNSNTKSSEMSKPHQNMKITLDMEKID